MKVIDAWTYRIQYDTGSGVAFELGLAAGKAGFTNQYFANDEEHQFLTKESLPFDIDDDLTEFESENQKVSCVSSDIALVNEDDEYEFETLSELIDEVFYENGTEIVLPKYDVILKIENKNSY